VSVRLYSLQAEALVSAVAALHLAKIQGHVLKHEAQMVAMLEVVVETNTMVPTPLVELL
jgi:hypothetical protein